MLTLAITLSNGETVRLTVQQAQFVVICPMCRLLGKPTPEFVTINPDEKFCSPYHRSRHWKRTHK